MVKFTFFGQLTEIWIEVVQKGLWCKKRFGMTTTTFERFEKSLLIFQKFKVSAAIIPYHISYY